MEGTMTLGPLEYTVIGFNRPDFSGRIVPEIQRVVEKKIIRLVDVVFVQKTADGEIDIVELDESDDPRFAGFAGLLEDRMGLLSPEDVATLAESLPVDSAALILLFEHRWAVAIKEALADAGGFLVARETISPEALEMLNAELDEASA
jgi:hypothetical protein